MLTRTCNKCGQIKEMSEFPPDKRAYNGHSYVCKNCTLDQNTRNKIDRKKRIQLVEDAKVQCVKCGETRKYMLDWHHIDPTNKSFSLSRGLREHGLASIKQELTKCVCLCRNCHAEFHHFYGQNVSQSDLNDYIRSGEYE